ncbi:hypothetical protein [Tannockella kyphosi]|uniref:hypothetical protein n=1 Tax=Tannockella kyphosi TaxID=2899121 RepID=UPI002012B7F9|nr:hypothetical protein [Tannockella kyphosi]
MSLNGSMQTMNKVQEISLIGILAAVNIASRVALQMLPNIKPVTSIIIISVLLFGLAFGIKLTIVTTLVSNMLLGMGLWTVFQILAWIVICLLTQLLVELFFMFKKKPPTLMMAVFSFLMGYVFGFIVSLEQFVLGGLGLFLTYYSSGILFDTFHAVGNFIFYLMAAPILIKIANMKGLSKNS